MMKIQKIYEQFIIAKIGYNKHWSSELRYGKHHIGSLQIPHLCLEQTSQQIMILKRTILNQKTSTLIKNVIETYQLQLGTECDPLQNQTQEKNVDSA